jgi:hypothetical protein
MINRAINRKKEDSLIKGILEVLSQNSNPESTQEIADKLNKPWHSIQTRCLRLQIESKLNGFRVGRMNLWQIKK